MDVQLTLPVLFLLLLVYQYNQIQWFSQMPWRRQSGHLKRLSTPRTNAGRELYEHGGRCTAGVCVMFGSSVPNVNYPIFSLHQVVSHAAPRNTIGG